jgi:high-affinity iron transporter
MNIVRVGSIMKQASKRNPKQPISPSNKRWVNKQIIDGKWDAFGADPAIAANGSVTIDSLVQLLENTLRELDNGNAPAALALVQTFNNSWLEVEGVVLTQSTQIYGDAERDMVTAKALLASNPPRFGEAKTTIQAMHDYLAPLAGKTSYTMADVITTLLREGIEAIL